MIVERISDLELLLDQIKSRYGNLKLAEIGEESMSEFTSEVFWVSKFKPKRATSQFAEDGEDILVFHTE